MIPARPAEPILVINPGSTSTRLALFRGRARAAGREIVHPVRDLRRFPSVAAQAGYREARVERFLARHLEGPLRAVAARGGLLRPVPGGVYRVNAAMCRDLRAAARGEHASNLGALIGASVAGRHSCEAFIADPVVVDELDPAARLTGMAAIERRSVFHALNQKAVARLAARRIGRPYERCRLIVAHLGGGISVGAHLGGRVVDVNNAIDGEGPFSAERSGGLPARPLAERVRAHPARFPRIAREIAGAGGLISHCGTNDLRVVLRRVSRGDRRAALVFEALVLRIAQEIAGHGATLRGRVDAVALTGGMARCRKLVGALKRRISFLGPVYVFAGEREMEALAENVEAALRGEREIREYPPCASGN